MRLRKDKNVRIVDVFLSIDPVYPYFVKVDFPSTFIDTFIDMNKSRVALWLEENIPLEYDDTGKPSYVLSVGIVKFRYEHDRTMMILTLGNI